jgi:hypothetical protein
MPQGVNNMGLAPNIKKKPFILKTCAKCGRAFGVEGFAPTKSLFFTDGTIPWCNDCVDRELESYDWNWDYIDKMCQMADIPFVPREWERLKGMNDREVFYRYATIFLSSEYEGIGWSDYYKAFKELKASGTIEEELPEIAEKRERELKEKWGGNYDMEAL